MGGESKTKEKERGVVSLPQWPSRNQSHVGMEAPVRVCVILMLPPTLILVLLNILCFLVCVLPYHRKKV
jgi:hypothetical protein